MNKQNFPTKIETELKTLKDLCFEFTYKDAPIGVFFGESKELKAEAIKWVKTPDMELWEFLEKDIEDGSVNDIYMLKIGLKKFFNLTSEDLE